MFDIAIPLQILGLEPSLRYHAMELYVFEVLQATFGLVHPVAIEGGLLIFLLVVPAVTKNVV